MKTQSKVLVLSLILGLFIWVLDATLDYFFFYRDSYLNLLLLEVPNHELYIRVLTLFWFVLFGQIISRMLVKQKQTETTLWQSEEKFRTLVNSMDDIVFELDRQQRHVGVFGRWLDRFGLSPEEFLGKTSRQIMGTEAAAVHEAANQQALEGQTVIYDWSTVSPSGTQHIQTSLSPLFNDQGAVVGIVGIGRDITRRVQVEQALRKVNRAYKLLSQSNQALLRATEEDPFLHRVCQLIVTQGDYSLAWIGLAERNEARTVRRVAQAGDKTGYLDTIEVTWADTTDNQDPTGTAIRTETPVIIRNILTESALEPWQIEAKKRGYLSLVSLPLQSEAQALGALTIYATAPDAFDPEEIELLTELAADLAYGLVTLRTRIKHKQAEEAVRQERDRTQQYLDVADIILLALNDQGKITLINRKGCEVLGYQEEELLGRNWFDLSLPPSQKEAVKTIFRQLMAGQIDAAKTAEGTVLTKSGQEKIIQWHNTVLQDKTGQIVGTLSSGEDVTERKELEEQFYQAQKMEAIGRLAGGVAHDFNNLLTAINGFTELMRYELAPEDPLQELLNKVLQSGQRATKLVRQLLAFSRKQVIEPQILELNTIVADIEKMLRRIIGEDVYLTTYLAQDLWSIKMDPTQIEQIIINLAVNARDAMPTGGKLIIETANVMLDETYVADHLEARPGEYVLLAVSDTGVGMTDAVKAHIFEPFFTTKGKDRGTGLGLATVYGIVKQSRGNIWVYSEKDYGTTFKIYLPRTMIGEYASPPKPEQSEEGLEGAETILLIEDDPGVRELITHTLRERGYTILNAANGQDGIRLAQEFKAKKIDLLLTDVVLPGLSGKEVADRLIPNRPDLKVLYMSGYTDNIVAHHGVVDPGVAFLQKPFRPTTLAHKVRVVLDRPPPGR